MASARSVMMRFGPAVRTVLERRTKLKLPAATECELAATGATKPAKTATITAVLATNLNSVIRTDFLRDIGNNLLSLLRPDFRLLSVCRQCHCTRPPGGKSPIESWVEGVGVWIWR